MSQALRRTIPTSPHYCAGCLAAVVDPQEECPGCSRSFAGTGRFNLMSGWPPRSDFIGWMRGQRE